MVYLVLPGQENKSSVFNKKKVDYHLLWSFEIIGNKIGRGGGEVLSLSENGSVQENW